MKFREKSTEEYTPGRSTGRALPGSEDERRTNVEHVGAERASITSQARGSDSPYVEAIIRGRTLSDDSPTAPAECHWHLVFVKKDDKVWVVFVGPWTTAGVAHYAEGAEILWIKFKLGAFMPHLPTGRFLDTETVLPGASSRSFWLKGSAWEFPRSRDRRDVRRQARAQRGARSRPARGHRAARPTAGRCHPVRCGTASCGPQGCPKAHPPDRARPTGGDPPATRHPDLRHRTRGRLFRSTASE